MPLINAHESLWGGGGWTGSSGDDCRDPLHVVQIPTACTSQMQ